MSFVPPLFTKFGKTASDLLSQKWDAGKDDFKPQVVVKSQANKVAVTSTFVSDDKTLALSSKVNVSYDDSKFGNVTLEYGSNGKVKATTKLSKLQPGLIVNGETELENSKLASKVAAEYARENFAGNVEYAQKKNNVVASFAVGFEGLSAGATARVDVGAVAKSAPVSSAVSVDAGVQYEDGNLIGTLLFEKQADVSLSVFHRVSKILSLASKYTYTPSKANTLAVGAQYKLSDDTTVKGKFTAKTTAEAKAVTFNTYLQHRFANPLVTVGVSHQFVVGGASDMGVSFTLGDK